jgi:hypothetical protein
MAYEADRRLQWLVPLIFTLITAVGILWLMYARLDVLSREYKDNIKFQQRTCDRLEFLETYCCKEFGHCYPKGVR